MCNKDKTLENAPINRYHNMLTARAAGGWFIDGYVLSLIGVILIYLSADLKLDYFWQGMLAASSVIGICIGGITGGALTDKYGRKLLFMMTPVLFALFSLLQYFSQSVEVIFISRFFIGLGVGIEYAVGSALLTEFIPKIHRGSRISSLVTYWFLGAAAAYIVGNILIGWIGTDAWRLVLVSPVVLSVILFVLRLGTLESPRWLQSKQRLKEANQIIYQVYGRNFLSTSEPEPNITKAEFKDLFRPGYLNRIVFVSLFWACSVIPVFAVYSFAPQVLNALNLQGKWGAYGSILLTLLFVVGCLLGSHLMRRIGRRSMLLHSLFWSLLALIGLGICADNSPFLILLLFGCYAIFIGGAQILTIVYPNEIFPTEIRALAVGVCASVSKIAVVVGTWLLPISIETIGIANTMFVAAGINLIGLTVSYICAIETAHLSLEQASAL